MDKDWIPESSEEWFEFLISEENETKNSYFAKPSNLIRDYRSELATSQDYAGREILELLQNAADQAKEADVKGKVVIELSLEGIIIANNGSAFSTSGVKSLQSAHLSPKRLRERQFIGSKGLGFRAILNWTNSPIILSAELALAYTEKVCTSKLEEFKAASTKLAELVSREQAISSSIILPVLPFPGFSINNELDELFCEQSLPLMKRCQYWKAQDYTTVIGIPFSRPELFNNAIKQIEYLRPEMLLFVNSLDEVKFVLPGKEELIWSKEGNDSASMVLANDEPLGIWQLFRAEGQVEEYYLDRNHNGDYHYELIVAVPEVESKAEYKSSPLFTYFPTEILLPLPIVCHATLELDQSRNQISNCKSNKFIFAQLANFLAEVAEKCALTSPTGDNAGFRVVMPIEQYPNALSRFDLPSLILKASQSRAIIPTLGGKALKPEEVFTLKGASKSWLPIKGFEDVTPTDDAEYQWFKSVGVTELSDDELKMRICYLKDLSTENRVKLILGLKSNKVSDKAFSSSLFVSADKKNVPDSAAIYISPKGGVPSELPSWMKLWFLDADMQQTLSDNLVTKEVRLLQHELREFGLKEYSFGRLVLDLRAQANKYKKANISEAKTVEIDLLRVIYGLYITEGKEKQRPTFPDKVSIEILSQEGSLVKAEKLYMGSGYGLQGDIMQQLYIERPDKLVAFPDMFNLEVGLNNEFGDFLEWIGVAKWPREIKVKKNNQLYLDMIIEQFKFPVSFGKDYIFNSVQDLNTSKLEISDYISLDGLDDILQPQKYMAIMAWISQDGRVISWRNREKRYATLDALKTGHYSYRRHSGNLPSYIQWQIENVPWLQGLKNTKFRAKDCVITDSLNESIFPRPALPSDIMLRPYGMDSKDVLESWRRSGVITSMAELSYDDIYSKLIDLPALQSVPNSAKTLYRWMLNAIDSASGVAGSIKDRFINSGKMWGKKSGEFDYFSINELFHTDSDSFPSELLNHLAIVELPNRVGSEKVKRAFGIQSIEHSAIKQTISDYLEAPTESDLDIYFQQAKPFFKYLRASQSGQTQYLKNLSKLKLVVCSKLHVQMQYEHANCSYELPEWGWLIDSDSLYIRSSDNLVTHNSDMLADAIGEALASLFRIANGGALARLFRCSMSERIALLSRILGEEVRSDQLADMTEQGDDELERISVLLGVSVIEEPIVVNAPNKSNEKLEQKIEVPTSSLPVSHENGNEDENSGTLSIVPIETLPKPAPIKQKLRVKKTSNYTGGQSQAYQPVNGDLSEQKIMEIEESVDPPRYPILVGQYMGNEGLGCDILSFSSENDRERFRSNKCRDLRLVERFIEVKGRRNKGASIELRGNEKDAAKKYASKYYLYRLFKSTEDVFSLSILQNPLNDVDAIEHSLYVHMDRSKHREEFEITAITGSREVLG